MFRTLGNCQIVFELTEKLALEVGLPYPHKHVCLKGFSKAPCLVLGCVSDSVTGRGEKKQSNPGVKAACP